MESNAKVILAARIVERTKQHTLIEISPGFDDEPWRMDLNHHISGPMGFERAAAYVTERYLLDHPTQLVHVGRASITQAVLQVLNPAAE